MGLTVRLLLLVVTLVLRPRSMSLIDRFSEIPAELIVQLRRTIHVRVRRDTPGTGHDHLEPEPRVSRGIDQSSEQEDGKRSRGSRQPYPGPPLLAAFEVSTDG